MKQETFINLLHSRWQERHFLCVGLDTDYTKLPQHLCRGSIVEAIFEFNRAIIEATAAYCCAFKPNTAFYEGYGLKGLEALIKTNRFIKEYCPEIPIILDAKRADIGNTNQGYYRAAYEIFQADALTVHPYLGKEALKPFLDDPSHGVIILCHTSNPGAGEFQELNVGGAALYQEVARRVATEWNINGNCGLVVGATYPEQLREVRKITGDLPILIPGVGAQGGDLIQTVTNGLNESGNGIIVNVSRSILYAAADSQFAHAAAAEAAKIDAEIRLTIERNWKTNVSKT